MLSRSFGPTIRWCLGFALMTLLAATAKGDGREIVVAAAISLQEPLTAIARRFEAEDFNLRVRLTFGSSGALAAQLRAGAPIDVLVVADERILADLAQRAVVEGGSQRRVARNRLVVIAAADFPAYIRMPEDILGDPVRRIAIPEASVPLGFYARSWLRDRKLLSELGPRIVPTTHARATLAAVDGGHVDLAIVYSTDARLARNARIIHEIPAAEQPLIAYSAVRTIGQEHSATAGSFLVFLEGDSAQEILHAAGFAAP
jgi:molybdate transport system substrate-binding protein